MQRQQRIAAARGAIDSYDGSGYCAEGYAENASDQYHAEVPSWVDECADAHWQPSGYAVDNLYSPYNGRKKKQNKQNNLTKS